jgi:hypothetical protein
MSQRVIDNSRLPGWRTVALVACLWFFCCALVGVFAAMFNGEFGSIGFVIFGFYIGIAGAVFDALLVRTRAFVQWPYSLQVIVASAGPLVLFVVICSGLGMPATIYSTSMFWTNAVAALGAGWGAVELVVRRAV